MKIKPFNTLILVEKLDPDKIKSGLVLPDNKGNFFVKFKVLAIGDLVEKVKVGTTILGLDLMDPIEGGSKIGFTRESNVFGEVLE